jgi:hypothetical protein
MTAANGKRATEGISPSSPGEAAAQTIVAAA